MEKYKVTKTGRSEKVHADTNGTPFIIIKGEFLKELGFYENTTLDILTQNDELILHNAEKYETRKRTNTEKQTMINDISNTTYDLITSEIPEDEATKAWERLDALTDELENKVFHDDNDNQTNQETELMNMTKQQVINGLEYIVNNLKEVEETDFTSCVTHEASQYIDALFSQFEEAYDLAHDGDCDTYDPETDRLSPLFPSVQMLFDLSIQPNKSECDVNGKI